MAPSSNGTRISSLEGRDKGEVLVSKRTGAASVITAIAESEMSDSDGARDDISDGNAIYASGAGNSNTDG